MEEFMTVVRTVSKFGKRASAGLMLLTGLVLTFHGTRLYDGVNVRARYVESEGVCRAAAVPSRNNARLLYFILGVIQIGSATSMFLADRDEEQRSSDGMGMETVVSSPNVNQALGDDPMPSNEWSEDPLDIVPTEPTLNIKDLLGYPSILIWGPQGSGKSTLAEYLVYKRQSIGHEVEILDPHAEFGQWEGLKLTGKGMKYGDIDNAIKTFLNKVVKRYEMRANTANYNPRPCTLLAEEMTQWEAKVEHGGEFFTTALSDIRKVRCHALFVAHNNTMSALGGAKGMAKARDNGLLEIELMPLIDPITGDAVPSGYGQVKFPGQQPIKLKVPDLRKETEKLKQMCKLNAQSAPTVLQSDSSISNSINVNSTLADDDDELPPKWADRVREVLEEGWKGEIRGETASPDHPDTSPLFTPDSKGFDENFGKVNKWVSQVAKPGYPANVLGESSLRTLLKDMIQNEMTQAEIIKAVWGRGKGGTDYYRQARAEFAYLTCNDGDN